MLLARTGDADGTCSALHAFLLEATLQRMITMMCVDRCHKSFARPWRKGDRVRHQDDELTHGQPAYAREYQSRADPHVPEQHRQNTDHLAALRCAPLTGTAQHERQQRGTMTIGNPVHGEFEPNGHVNISRDMVEQFNTKFDSLKPAKT